VRISRQAYQGEADDQGIRAFLNQKYAIAGHPYCAEDPPNWERLRVSVKMGAKAKQIHLWTVDDRSQRLLVGMILYNESQCEFSYLVHPDYQVVENMIYDWVEN